MGKKNRRKVNENSLYYPCNFSGNLKVLEVNRKFILNETILRDLNNSLFILCTLSHVILI